MKAKTIWKAAKRIDRRHLAIGTEAYSIDRNQELSSRWVELAQWGEKLEEIIQPESQEEMADMGMTRLMKLGIATEGDI